MDQSRATVDNRNKKIPKRANVLFRFLHIYFLLLLITADYELLVINFFLAFFLL
jgi:hypothetical protein